MMPQEPFIPPPIRNPSVPQRITDAGGMAGYYGQTPAQQEAARGRQGGGREAAGMPADEWVQRTAHDQMRQSASYADAERRRREQPSTPISGPGKYQPSGFSYSEPGAQTVQSPSPSSAESDEFGARAGLFILLLTAAFCLPPFLHHNNGVGFGHLGWDLWKLMAIGVAIWGALAGVAAIIRAAK